MHVEKTQISVKIIFWFFLCAAAFLFFLWGNTREIFWYDEALCAIIAQKSYAGIINALSTDVYPPLYFVVLKGYATLFGDSVFVYRSFSALGAVALIALGAGPLRRLLSFRAGIIYAFITLACPMTLIMAQESKMYSWSAFFVTGAFAYGLLSLRENKTYDWCLWGAFTLGAAYIHYFALLPLVIMGGIGLAWILRHDRKKLKPFFIITLVMLMCYLPWLRYFVMQTKSVMGNFWIPPVNIWAVLAALAYPFSYKFSMPFEYTILPALIISLLCLGWGVRAERGSLVDRPGLMAAGCFFLTLVILICISLFKQPVLTPRYLYPSSGLFFLAVVTGILRIEKKSLQAALCFVFFVLAIPQVIKIETQYFNGPRPALVAFLQENMLPDDIIIHTNVHTPAVCSYYLPDRQQYFFIGKGFKLYDNYKMFEPTLRLSAELSPIVKNRSRVWLIDGRNKYLDEACNADFGQPWVYDYFTPLPDNPNAHRSFEEQCSWFLVDVACLKPDHDKIALLGHAHPQPILYNH